MTHKETAQHSESSKPAKYFSTNLSAEPVDFRTALLRGQAEDKGLYMPERIPRIVPKAIEYMREMNLTYPEIAFSVMGQFLEGEGLEDLWTMAKDAYNFEVPVEQVYGANYILWLDRGPTLSFKDLAARMMSRLMQHYSEDMNGHITVLTATSGDTGSAVANAFYGLEGMHSVVLFPKDEVTELQRKQMTTLGDNVTAFAVQGKFDDCQAMVKRAFGDEELRDLGLSSANSINIGRLIPQTVQFFYAYSRIARKPEEQIVVSVPCGNFGHLTAGLFAKEMGLPIRKFVAATNENDEFPRFIGTGKYEKIVPSRDCISNAMNVGNPSNLARIVYMYGGRINERGDLIAAPDMDAMRRDIYSTSITDQETRETIKEVYGRYGIILEPHGAVAWRGLQEYLDETETEIPTVSFETASPGKFSVEIEKLGIKPRIPDALLALATKKEHFEEIPKDYEVFKKALRRSAS